VEARRVADRRIGVAQVAVASREEARNEFVRARLRFDGLGVAQDRRLRRRPFNRKGIG